MSTWPTWATVAFGAALGAAVVAFILLIAVILGSTRIERINWRLNVDRQEQRQRGRFTRVMDGWQRQRVREVRRGRR